MVPVFKKGRKVNNFDLYANHSWYVPGVKGMFVLLGWFLVGNLLASLLVAIFGMFVPQQVLLDYSMLVVYPLSFIPAMMYAAHKSQRNSLFETGYKLNSSNFGPFKAWQMVLITIVLTYSFMVAFDYPNYLNFKLTTQNGFMKQFYDILMETLSKMTGGPLWSSFLLTAIFAPIFEEWLCRGMVLRGLLTRMKPGWAIVVSALFFALIHMNPWQALNAFLIGLVMGYIYYKTGSLWLTMLIHFVNNGTSVVVAQLSSVEESSYFYEMMSQPTYGIVSLVAIVALVACLYAFKRIPVEQEHGNMDTVELKVD